MNDTILVADENIQFLDKTRLILEKNGFHFLQALNGEEAKHKLESESIDILLVQLQLPVINGPDLYKFIQKKELPIAHALLVEQMSRLPDQETLHLTDTFLKRPLRPKELITCVLSLCTIARLRQSYQALTGKTNPLLSHQSSPQQTHSTPLIQANSAAAPSLFENEVNPKPFPESNEAARYISEDSQVHILGPLDLVTDSDPNALHKSNTAPILKIPPPPSVAPTENALYPTPWFQKLAFLEIKRAIRFNQPLSMLLVSFDFSEAFLHAHTPQLLKTLNRKLAQCILNVIREIDIPVQFSEDNILILLPNTGIEGAIHGATRIRNETSQALQQELPPELGPLTISIGATTSPSHHEFHFNDLLKDATRALREVRSQGGDGVFYC